MSPTTMYNMPMKIPAKATINWNLKKNPNIFIF